MRHLLLVLSVPSLFATTLPAQQPAAVSPADRAAFEGSSFTHFPLGRASARMQTLHRDVPGGTVIAGHAYRRDAITVRGLVDGFQCDLRVTLSMSPNQPTQASGTFAANVGPNAIEVLPRTILSFPPTTRPGIDPAPTFELLVPYQVPFVVPAGGGTLCVDVEVFGNSSPAGSNVNLSLYLDAHELYSDGRVEQPGFRTLTGCAAPGQTTASHATMSLWRLTTGSRFDIAIRDGMPGGGGAVLPLLLVGNDLLGAPMPGRPDCNAWSSAELVFVLPGTTGATGSYDGSLTGLPFAPPGFRLWCQALTLDFATLGLAMGDASTLLTPPPGPQPIPVARVVNSTNQSAPTGAVSFAVPVMAFF